MLSWTLLLMPATFFGWRGYRHGLLEAVSRATGLLGGYITALLFTLPLGRWIENHTDLPGLLPYMVASAVFLFGVSILISLLFDLINHLWPNHLRSETLASLGGALFGALIGACIGLLLIWAASLILGFTQGRIQSPSELAVTAQRLAGRAVHLTLARFDPPPAVRTASAAFLQSPQDTVARLQRISMRHDIKNLLRDPNLQAVLNSNDLQQLQQHPEFQQLVKDKDMQHLLTITGPSHNKQERLAQGLNDLWQRLQRLQTNPEYQALLRNKEFRQQLHSGNPLVLISSPELQRFTELVLETEASPRAPM